MKKTLIEVTMEPEEGLTANVKGKTDEIMVGITAIADSFYEAARENGFSDMEARAMLRGAMEAGIKNSKNRVKT